MSDDTDKRRRNPYLPALPDGWEYEVTIKGPHGALVEIDDAGVDEGGMVITTVTADGTRRVTSAPDLGDALRTAAAGIKALSAVEQQEAEAKAAREAALAALGNPPVADSAVTPVE